MQDSYLTKHNKGNGKLLPTINVKKAKQVNSAWIKMKKPTEESLLLQIQDIDASLNNKNFTCHYGNLFSSQISDKLIGDLHSCLKKQSAIIEDGFSLWNSNELAKDYSSHSESKRLTTKIETLNQKIIKLSMQNVYEYDLRKYMQIIKSNKSRWSLFKRLEPNNSEKSKLTKLTSVSQDHRETQNTQRKPNSIITPSVHDSVSNSYLNIPRNNDSPIKSQQTTLSPISKLGKGLGQSHNISRISQMRQKAISKRKILTEISQLESPEDQVPQISKYDIKNMLKKETNNIVFIWLPPSTYPQFHGMFTYASTRKLAVCRLKKYFFFRRGLSPRFFNSVIEQISSREGRYIQSIELTTNKYDYTKIFELMGWKMKCLEGMDKIRIRFNRQTQ